MDAEVSCPYSNDVYACESKLQDREIQAVRPATHSLSLGHLNAKLIKTYFCNM